MKIYGLFVYILNKQPHCLYPRLRKAFCITLRTLYVLSHCKKTINFSVLLAKKVSQRTNFQGKYAKEKNVKLNKIYRLHFIPKEIIFKEFENILYVWYI